MPIISTYPCSLEEAIDVVFGYIGTKGMSHEVAALFASALEPDVAHQEVDKLVASTTKSKYGRGAKWGIQQWWLVAVPWPRFEARGLPSLVVEGRVYAVAAVEVIPEWSRRTGYTAVVEPLAKPLTTVLPLCFLRSLLDGELARYRKVGKDGPWTWWEVPGLKQPLRLHDALVKGLVHTFKLKPVAQWLTDFGAHGASLAPLVVGSLLGLMYRDSAGSLPLEKQPWSREALLQVVTGLGYSSATARTVVERAEAELGAAMTLEEASLTVLRCLSKGV